MKVGIMLPIFGETTWAAILDQARLAEAEGLDSVWIADHLIMRLGDGEEEIHEAWTLTSAVAASTTRVAVGQMVLCASFRAPALVAKMAATLDCVAPGRIILGVGAGWHDPEYEAFGFPTDHKVGRFAEWIEIVARLLRRERFTFEGEYYTVKDCVLAPPPENRVPILIASKQPRMHGLVAKWADQWNSAWYGTPDEKLQEDLQRLADVFAAEGRDLATLERTIGMFVADPDRPDEGPPTDAKVPATVEELAYALRAYEELGIAHIVAFLMPSSTASVKRLSEAAAQIRS